MQPLPLSPNLKFLDAIAGGIRGICGVSGPPGSTKSILSMQIAADLAARGMRSLVVATEQTSEEIEDRKRLITADWPRPQATAAMDGIMVEPNLYDVRLLPEMIMREVLSPAGRFHDIKLLILDSIQGHGLPAGAVHAYGKVLEGATLAKRNGITSMLISHVIKSGDIAGPQFLGHGLDLLIMMRSAMHLKFMSVTKNRHGSVSTRPLPLMIEPKALRLTAAPHAKPAPAAARSYGGAGSGLVQVQASVTLPTGVGTSGKLTAPGLPRKEIEQLIDCCSQVKGLDLSDLNYSIQCRLPNRMQYLCHFSLPLAIALIGSFIRKPIPADCLYLGEIDLFRNVLDLPLDLLQNLIAAIDAGELAPPLRLFVPPSAVRQLSGMNGRARVEPCQTLEEAILKTWPDLEPEVR
jgi:DNA repair protein RadA/Sms